MNVSSLPSPKLLLRDHLAFAAMTAVGLFITIAAITIGYDLRSGNSVEQSFWVEAATGIAPPYALGIGIYLMVVTFPRYVLYGETRKRFAQRIMLFSVPFALGLTLLALAGFLAEGLLYRTAGWNHAVEGNHLFDSTGDVPQFVLELFIQILPWFAFGALFGAIYLGPQHLLIAAIPLGVLGVGLVNILLGLDDGPGGLVGSVITPDANTSVAIVVSLLFTVAALWGMRAVTRAMPIQSQKA
jgi:hypothetical protein